MKDILIGGGIGLVIVLTSYLLPFSIGLKGIKMKNKKGEALEVLILLIIICFIASCSAKAGWNFLK